MRLTFSTRGKSINIQIKQTDSHGLLLLAQQVGKKSAQLLLARLHNETVNELTVELDFNIESGGSV